LLYGSIGQLEGVINRITGELGNTPRIVATGGLAPTIAAESDVIQEVDETLTLFGLRKIYENNRQV